jgi:hypothetical protein
MSFLGCDKRSPSGMFEVQARVKCGCVGSVVVSCGLGWCSIYFALSNKLFFTIRWSVSVWMQVYNRDCQSSYARNRRAALRVVIYLIKNKYEEVP